MVVDFESNKASHAAVPRRDGRTAKPKERIKSGGFLRDTVESEAVFSQLDRKCRRMRPLLVTTLNRLVRDEPRISPASLVTALSVIPPFDVRLMLIGNPYAQSVDLYSSRLGEMKNELLTIVKKLLRPYRLEVTPGKMASVLQSNRNGLDPVNCILKDKEIAESEHDLVRE